MRRTLVTLNHFTVPFTVDRQRMPVVLKAGMAAIRDCKDAAAERRSAKGDSAVTRAVTEWPCHHHIRTS